MEQDFIYIKETGTGSESAVRNVAIRIKSIVEGVDSQWETTGEYKWDGRQHMLAYTDYTGNAITKNGICCCTVWARLPVICCLIH